jgi:hypothetical protein
MTSVIVSLLRASSKALFRLSEIELLQTNSMVEVCNDRRRSQRSKRESKQRGLKFGSKD